VESHTFEPSEFFGAVFAEPLRVLLIGRQALVVLGAPVLTADYDVWIHIDDIELLNARCAPLHLVPNRSPQLARQSGRYVLENDERVDVLVARSLPTVDGVQVVFDDVWTRRKRMALAAPAVESSYVELPSIADLILTKQFGARKRDVADIEYLEVLHAAETGEKR
jgi:hypothetical protein